jgi:large subunit ribosomal protein L4
MINKKEQTMPSDMQLHAITTQDLSLEGTKAQSRQAFSTCVRSLLQGWRQGTVASKGRSDVALTNKKPWKQKGTGRARAGSARSPLWRGGGVIFGPQERTRSLKVNKKMRRGVLSTVLRTYLDEGKVFASDWYLNNEVPKTALAARFLKHNALNDKKIVLFVMPGDVVTYASFANIPNVSLLYFDQPNVFDLVNSDRWIMFNRDLDRFKEMVSKWN